MWTEKLEEIIHHKSVYGEKINVGASEEELKVFLEDVRRELKIYLPDEYVRFLKIVNGIEFNGFILYGIDQRFLSRSQNQIINGFIENNSIWYENEWQKKYIFIGESNISWYVYDLNERKWYELDNPSGRETEMFVSMDNLVEKILGDALI